ncbi:transcription initiation factor TFIID subunit 4-like isoform X2 [Limanda limanda]|uniref:transcription initiation factor TFIID subunit 4-like isoform X2 n=1 Tax=Limanda limanda TaxID=27771 RepID=UPI0029C963A2|nr:transcription initiation factor TFIID subunit 4-like isoform X2 [Limanda limanda]
MCPAPSQPAVLVPLLNQLEDWRGVSSQRGAHGSTSAMDASTDSTAGSDPGQRTLVGGGGATSSHPGTVGSGQTCNGSHTVNSSGSGEPGSKGLSAAFMHPAATSVIQPPLMHPQGVVSSAGATVTLVRPPMQNAWSGATLNGNNNVVAAGATGQPGVYNVQHSTPGSFSARPPTTILHTAPQPAVTYAPVGWPQAPGTLAAGPGGIPGMTPQMFAPRLQQPPPPQQNIQVPPGMVIIRNENGQLLMIPQQALAQMQAQSQAGMMPRPALQTNVPFGQAPGNICRQVAPPTIIQQGYPAPTTFAATTTLHRPPILQSSVGAAVPGMTPMTYSQTAGTTVLPVTVSKETMDNVIKCRNFLSTLIKLASNGNHSPQTAAVVKELTKDLLEGKLEPEEFTSSLYKELKSSPQSYLVPFLKKSLPALRQFTPDSAAFIQQSELPQLVSGPVFSTSFTPTVVLSGPAPCLPAPCLPAPCLPAPISRPQLQPSIGQQGQTASMVLQLQQQRVTVRPQVNLPTTPVVMLRNQAPGRIMLGQQQAQHKGLHATFSAAHKNKLREASGYVKDYDELNDVASMAGVNLCEESTNILASNSGLMGVVTHSCKDEPFLPCSLLQKRMLEIGSRHGMTNMGAELVNLVSHATQQRLRNLLESVSQVAQQRNVNFKEDDKHEQNDDVRAQLRFFHQLDSLEKQRKEEEEREILLKAAKSRTRQEDPEQLRLKQKAKEMQQQELAQVRQREANMTALAAIGPRKKKRILDSQSSSAAAEGSGAGPSLPGGAGAASSRPTRQRITRVNLRDLLFCLENEKSTSPSHFLYKGFLK